MLDVGTKAPAFELPDQNGVVHTLEEFQGKKVVLYFYPKDNTAGCSKQACAFGELFPHFQEKGAVVIGVSKDSVASHKKFEQKFQLPFILLSDTELQAIQAYDVWKEKNMYGKITMTTSPKSSRGMLLLHGESCTSEYIPLSLTKSPTTLLTTNTTLPVRVSMVILMTANVLHIFPKPFWKP